MEKLDNHINKYKELKAPHTGIHFGVVAGSGSQAFEVVSGGGTTSTNGAYTYHTYSSPGTVMIHLVQLEQVEI